MDERKRRLAEKRRKEVLLKKKRAAQKRLLIALSCLLLVIIVVVICVISFSGNKADLSSVEPTPTPVSTPQPTSTPVPNYLGKVSLTETSREFTAFLPHIREAETTAPMIAITIDDLDLSLADNLAEIIDIANIYNAKLTLFPIGNQLADASIKSSINRAFSRGFEIENHTMNHKQVYKLSDEELFYAIVDQQTAVSQALGVDYKMRFFRLPGGNGEIDPRVHFYLNYLGYEALADWSISGSDYSLEKIKSRVKPGSILLFHTTTSDLKKIKKLVPYLVGQGYRLVTLNELLGYPDNECYLPGSLTIPEFVPFEYNEFTVLKSGQKSYPVRLLQERLIQLGYLPSDSVADGIFGDQTASAIKQFQISHNLDATGIADIQMQSILFSDTALPH